MKFCKSSSMWSTSGGVENQGVASGKGRNGMQLSRGGLEVKDTRSRRGATHCGRAVRVDRVSMPSNGSMMGDGKRIPAYTGDGLYSIVELYNCLRVACVMDTVSAGSSVSGISCRRLLLEPMTVLPGLWACNR
eukprot:5386843-Amphidinium_carterae.3